MKPEEMKSKERARLYQAYVPMDVCTNHFRERYPVLFFLPGTTTSSSEFIEAIRASAMREKFIYIEPVPYKNTWNAQGSGCCGDAGVEKWTDEATFLEDILHTIRQNLPMWESAVYVAGHGSGALMAARMAR